MAAVNVNGMTIMAGIRESSGYCGGHPRADEERVGSVPVSH
jgi:hypothetical protein